MFKALSSTATSTRYLATCRNLAARPRTLSSITSAKTMSGPFLEAVEKRRSLYALSKEMPVKVEKVEEIIKHAVKHVPSSFNAQSGRVVLLVGDEHTKLWNIVSSILKPIVPADGWAATEGRMNMFSGAAGTILFFEDILDVQKLEGQFPQYKENFAPWSQQSNGMLQYAIWTALEAEGFGCSVQHYNPLISNKVLSEWKLPENWQLMCQMPFGKPVAPPGEKTFKPIEDERFKVFGK